MKTPLFVLLTVKPPRPLLLLRYFKNSPTFWMNLQTRYDLEVAEEEVERDVRPLEARSSR